ncbi:acyl-CoA dehydrogenase family protein [Streptomyces venezuelae]|uniref:Acyl-CoA dehydrogenase/oxidase N-terminal domain-containing protein n=1 Tax=Streptomyces venezuelae TaxID=54571 RepID=A0A5P2B7P5_STRVZ|nr:acyl-CoA dehydrogenase family protein [Streptomyces venezuelae]QES25221.1 hypothetical protein DEJ47_00995 [Streptomyces venezuelae]
MDAADTTVLLDRVRGTVDEPRRGVAEVDSGRAAPHRGNRLVRRAGLLGLLMPREFGGAEVSFLDRTKVLETLATGDGATALGLATHYTAIGSLCETGVSELPAAAVRFRTWLFREVVEHGRMLTSATTQTGTGTGLRDIHAT